MNMIIEDGYLILPSDYKNKKITATSFYGLIGGNKFKPKGDYLLSVLGLLKEPFDEFYSKRGEVAEEVLNNWLKSKGYQTKTWNKFDINFDNFPSHPKLGGMIDIAIVSPMRCVVECKSKNIKDFEKIQRFPNLEQEHQALFYGYMSKCDNIKIIYVFFTDEQEQAIRDGKFIDKDFNNFKFYEKDLTIDKEDITKKLECAIEYKEKCIRDGKIPLSDISSKAMDLMGLLPY